MGGATGACGRFAARACEASHWDVSNPWHLGMCNLVHAERVLRQCIFSPTKIRKQALDTFVSNLASLSWHKLMRPLGHENVFEAVEGLSPCRAFKASCGFSVPGNPGKPWPAFVSLIRTENRMQLRRQLLVNEHCEVLHELRIVWWQCQCCSDGYSVLIFLFFCCFRFFGR